MPLPLLIGLGLLAAGALTCFAVAVTLCLRSHLDICERANRLNLERMEQINEVHP